MKVKKLVEMLFRARVSNQREEFKAEQTQQHKKLVMFSSHRNHQTMATPQLLFLQFSIIIFTTILLAGRNTIDAAGGRWELLQQNIGITAMHMQLLHNDRVIIFDRTDFGTSNISLPNGQCRKNDNELAVKVDCTAHSVEYNVLDNSVRALTVRTDVWCSSGTVAPSGHLVQTGGFNDGDRVVRTIGPCKICDWQEINAGLIQRRWYATNHILPDGRAIVIGGRHQFNYEFYPKTASDNKIFSLPFLAQTSDGNAENNLYPFVHLNVDGNMFIFANNRAILLDYTKNVIVKTYPPIPGSDPRSYPSTGSAVLLPLKSEKLAEVLICGGAPRGSYKAKMTSFTGALSTCARIRITDVSPQWSMETMLMARCMGDMIILPNGNVLIINGVAAGTAGWENGRKPVLNPVLYRPGNPSGARFEMMNPSRIPRVYHSSAVLLRDGRVLVGGSNPHVGYSFTGVLFPTELRLEAFSPDYLDSNFRPKIINPVSETRLNYRQPLAVQFSLPGCFDPKTLMVTMVAPSFTTHSYGMNQRLLVLQSVGNTKLVSSSVYKAQVMTPSSAVLAPPGYYMLFVVHKEIPSKGVWVLIK